MQRNIRYLFSRYAFTVISLLLLAYFSFHFVSGNNGYLARMKLEEELAHAQAQLKKVTQEKEVLENHVHQLQGAHIDADLLDERIRAMLNHAQDDEIIIFYEDKK